MRKYCVGTSLLTVFSLMLLMVPCNHYATTSTSGSVSRTVFQARQIPALAKLAALEGDDGRADSLSFMKGVTEYRAEKWTEAIESLNGHIKKYPKGRYTERAYFLLAQSCAQFYGKAPSSHFIEIKGYYEEAMNRFPASVYVPVSLLAVGDLCLKVGNDYEALGYYNLVAKKYSDTSAALRALMQKARILFRRKKRDEAMSILHYLVRRYPGTAEETEARIEMSKIIYAVNDFNKSLGILSSLIDADPDNIYRYPEISLYLGYNYYQLGDNRKARETLLRFYNSCPDKDVNHLILAKIADTYRIEGLFEDAVKFYQLVLERYPEKEGSFISLIRLAELQEKGELRIKRGIAPYVNIIDREIRLPRKIYENVLNSIVSKDNESPLVQLTLLKLAVLYQREGDHDNSLRALRELFTIYSRAKVKKEIEEVFSRTLGAIFREQLKKRRYNKIVNTYLREKNLFSLVKSPDAFLNGARAALHLNLKDVAMEMFKRAEPLLPDKEKPPDLLFIIGRGLLQKGRIKDALARLNLLIARYPNNRYTPYSYHLKGKILFTQERYPAAVEMFSVALRSEMRPCRRVKVLIDKARALASIERAKEALRVTNEADELKGNCFMTDQGVYSDIGDLYLALGYPEKALAVFPHAPDTGKEKENEIVLKLKVAQHYESLKKKEDYLPLYNEISNSEDTFWSNLAKEKIEEIDFNKEIGKMETPRKKPGEPEAEKKPAVFTGQEPARPQGNDDVAAIRKLVAAWKQAWEKKDLEGFMAHYADGFLCRGMNRSTWRQRKAGVNQRSAFIKVTISNVTIKLLSPEKAIVSFTQDYRSTIHHDRGTKTLELVKAEGVWKIVHERWRL